MFKFAKLLIATACMLTLPTFIMADDDQTCQKSKDLDFHHLHVKGCATLAGINTAQPGIYNLRDFCVHLTASSDGTISCHHNTIKINTSSVQPFNPFNGVLFDNIEICVQTIRINRDFPGIIGIEGIVKTNTGAFAQFGNAPNDGINPPFYGCLSTNAPIFYNATNNKVYGFFTQCARTNFLTELELCGAPFFPTSGNFTTAPFADLIAHLGGFNAILLEGCACPGKIRIRTERITTQDKFYTLPDVISCCQ